MIGPHFPWIAAGVLVMGLATGWHIRGLQADAKLAAFKESLAKTAADQRDLKAKVEARQAVTTAQSTQRLDQQAATREQEIRYVEKEVIHYRDRWRDSACRLPAEWLQLYNRSLGLADGAVPKPADL